MSTPEKPRGPVAIDSIPWTDWKQGVRYASRWRVLSDTRGGDKRKIGISYEELPPGHQSCPFHYHMVEEEHIIGLEGEATLRLGDERLPIKAGDYVCFPAGQRAGHCLVNEGDKPFRYIMLGDRAENETCVYPDSGKIMIYNLGRHIVREGDSLDYWDGEREDEPISKS
jgi:uncharacterized cupin superfamily protein